MFKINYKAIVLWYENYHDTKTVVLVIKGYTERSGYYFYKNNSNNFVLKNIKNKNKCIASFTKIRKLKEFIENKIKLEV